MKLQGIVLLLLFFLPIFTEGALIHSDPSPPSVSLDFAAVAWIRSYTTYNGQTNTTDLGTFLWKNNYGLRSVLLIGTPFDRAVNSSSTSSGRYNHYIMLPHSTTFSFDPTAQMCDSQNGCLKGKCCVHENPNEGCSCLTVDFLTRMWEFYHNSTAAGDCVVGPREQGTAWSSAIMIQDFKFEFTLCFSKRLNAPAWVQLDLTVSEKLHEGYGFLVEFSDWDGTKQPDNLFVVPSFCNCANNSNSNNNHQKDLRTNQQQLDASRFVRAMHNFPVPFFH